MTPQELQNKTLNEIKTVTAITVKGNPIKIQIGNLGMIGNDWGMMLSVYMLAEYEGINYRIEPYFDHYSFVRNGKRYCVLTLKEAHKIEEEYLKGLGYNSDYFGGDIKL